MSAVSLLLFFGVLAGMATGQSLFKITAQRVGGSGVMGIIQDPLFYVSCAVYGVVTLLWIALLTREPLSKTYAATALNYVVVPAVGILLFKEQLTISLVIGIVLIIAGVGVIMFGSSQTAQV